MSINIEKAIAWMNARRGKVTYSMIHRDGPNSYDCSSSVYYALMSAGAKSAGWAVNTEYEHDWLKANGYELISENQDWDAQRGDIFIWGCKGQSAGAGGHTGIFVDPDNIIHCNAGWNGITINNYNQTAEANGWMYVYVYRLKKLPATKAVPAQRKPAPRQATQQPSQITTGGQPKMMLMRFEIDTPEGFKKGEVWVVDYTTRTMWHVPNPTNLNTIRRHYKGMTGRDIFQESVKKGWEIHKEFLGMGFKKA